MEYTEDGGTRTGAVPHRASPLTDNDVRHVVSQPTGYGRRALGLAQQLQPVADVFDRETPLGTLSPPGGFGHTATGPENALANYLEPLAFEYLRRLQDVAEPEPELADHLVSQLEELADRGEWIAHCQVALDGIDVEAALGPYKGVVLRPLTPAERGAAVASHGLFNDGDGVGDGYMTPQNFDWFFPRVLFEWEEPYGPGYRTTRQLRDRLALALFLRGHDVASNGTAVEFPHPRWASPFTAPHAFAVQPRATPDEPTQIDPDEFQNIVDLAESIPDFSSETNSKHVALGRGLRGLGAEQPDFLDLAIALEAAILRGSKDQLRYKFALYGTLYLDPEELGATFKQLLDIYDVRSALAHGSSTTPERLPEASKNARTHLLGVLRKALIHDDWPSASALNKLAYTQRSAPAS